MVDINRLRNDPLTEEEETEELRYLDAILTDLRKDTGKPTSVGEERSTNAAATVALLTKCEINVSRYGCPPTTVADRVMRDTQEWKQWVDPLAGQSRLHDHIQQAQQQQRLFDAAKLGPPLDLRGPDARWISDQQMYAAVARITAHWAAFDLARQHADMQANVFGRNSAAMASEAERMLSIYGPALTEQTQFLSEYYANLGLFHTGLTSAAHERADLLARIGLPASFATGFIGYHPVNIKRIQEYCRSAILALEADYGRSGNPVHGWEAVSFSRRFEIELPAWVLKFVSTTAEKIMQIRDNVADGKPAEREAELVGRALGFGDRLGPGRFKQATLLKRDRSIYFEVRAELQEGRKLDFAYDTVAKARDISRSSVVRAYRRIVKLNDNADNQK